MSLCSYFLLQTCEKSPQSCERSNDSPSPNCEAAIASSENSILKCERPTPIPERDERIIEYHRQNIETPNTDRGRQHFDRGRQQNQERGRQHHSTGGQQKRARSVDFSDNVSRRVPDQRPRRNITDNQPSSNPVANSVHFIQQSNDDSQIFGDFVASELRQLRSEEHRRKLRRLIQQAIIHVAELDEMQFAPSFSQSNVTMTSPEGNMGSQFVNVPMNDPKEPEF